MKQPRSSFSRPSGSAIPGFGVVHVRALRSKPRIWRNKEGLIQTEHETLEPMYLLYDSTEEFLFTENETNFQRLYGSQELLAFCQRLFSHLHRCGRQISDQSGTSRNQSCSRLSNKGCRRRTPESVYLRLVSVAEWDNKPKADSGLFDAAEKAKPTNFTSNGSAVSTRFTKTSPDRRLPDYSGPSSFISYIVKDWLAGDQYEPKPPSSRCSGRNHEWLHVYSRDVISMPDKWEYPWFAAWDLAFHMLPFAHLDSHFAKQQLELFLREWYMHPNGQIPAYEFAFSDVNPPVHAWAAWRVYKISAPRGSRDINFLESVFHKLLLNFTWWVNRKDTEGNNIFSGGFLGLDNIGVFDRSKPLPTGGYLQQADGTAWMAFYCLTMLSMALELAQVRPAY